jgi:predicted GNAT superfamily acetyltransferase
MPIEIRDLHSLDEYRAVVQLEEEIWGYTDPADTVTVPVFIITVKRGGILIGAFDGSRMIGFAFSIVGMKDRRPTQWSHMMGVVAGYRRSGLGRALKLAQRDRAIAGGFDLMEWTFDPLQALNAHLNFTKLGVVCDEYARNLYGESTSALHRGTPTDRFVVQWQLREAHVERRIAQTEHGFTLRASDAATAPIINETMDAGEWRRPGPVDFTCEAPRLWVEIPVGFTEIQQRAPALALEWRQCTREIFETYFGRGYRVVDFELQKQHLRGRYLLALTPAAS